MGLFVAALTQGGDLNARMLASDRTPPAWVSLARDAGYEFTVEELQGFMQELLDLDELDAEGSVEAFLSATTAGPGELTDRQLDEMAAGGLSSMVFSSGLMRRMSSLGFSSGPSGASAGMETFPPMHIQNVGDAGQFTQKR